MVRVHRHPAPRCHNPHASALENPLLLETHSRSPEIPLLLLFTVGLNGDSKTRSSLHSTPFHPQTLTGAKATALPFLRFFFQFVDALWSPRRKGISEKGNSCLQYSLCKTLSESKPHHLQAVPSRPAPLPPKGGGVSNQQNPVPWLVPVSSPPYWGQRLYFPKASFSRTFPASRSRLHCPHRPHPHPWRNPRPQPHEDQVRPPSFLPSNSPPCRSGTWLLGKLSRREKVINQVDQSKTNSRSRPLRGKNTQWRRA